MVADGTTVHLGPLPEKRPFEAKVVMQEVDVASMLATRTPKKVMTGKFNGNVDLQGVGYTPDKLKETLLGAINGNLEDSHLPGSGRLSARSPSRWPRRCRSRPRRCKSGDVTSMGENLPFGVEIKNGVAQLEKPITWTRPEAAMRFEGGIRLDGVLDLTGTVRPDAADGQQAHAGEGDAHGDDPGRAEAHRPGVGSPR